MYPTRMMYVYLLEAACYVDPKPAVKSSHTALRHPAAPKCNVTHD